jgi:hypothetical protein
VNTPVPDPALAHVPLVVGLAVALQQTPWSVTVPPPSAVTCPPVDAVVELSEVGRAVVTVGVV